MVSFGKSYADFEIETKDVQIYYSAPQGDLAKPYQELAAFAKTALL